MHKTSFYIINGISIYRVVAAFILLYIIIIGRVDIFKWLLAFSFFTDSIDGFLARKFKVVSVMGSRIDSIGDDLTVLVAVIGIYFFEPAFIHQYYPWLLILFGLLLIQTILALYRYGRPTSFHTYLAKLAMLFQGIFLILFFFLPEWPIVLFFIAVSVTMLDLIEEIIMILYLPEWQADVKGLFWIKKKKNKIDRVPE